MKKFVFSCVIVCCSVGLSAQATWAKSYNTDGQVNLNATVGYNGGLCLNAGGEWVIGEFALDSIPIDFGVMARATFKVSSWNGYDGFSWAAGPLVGFHMGLADLPLEWFIGAGLCLYGYGTSAGMLPGYPDLGVGFAGVGGLLFHLSKEFRIIVEAGWMGSWYWGGGVLLRL